MGSPTETLDAGQADRYGEFAQDEGRTLSRFVDWLEENDMAICVANGPYSTQGEEWVQAPESHESLFARFAGIDLDAVERHRRQLLESLNPQGVSHGK